MNSKSEYQKLENIVANFELILHPKFMEAFRTQLMACREQDKREAYAAAKISDEALKIEAMIKDLKERMERFKDTRGIGNFHLKVFYKELLTMFDINKTKNTQQHESKTKEVGFVTTRIII